MSEIRQTIGLDPPTMSNTYEDMVGAPCECPICHGMGWYWQMPPMGKDAEKTKCGYCEGTGKLIPYVHIRWGAPIDEERLELMREEALKSIHN